MKISYPQIYFFLFFSIFWLIGCGPKDDDCTQTKYETVRLSQSDNSKVLYSGLDTLKFINNQGDTEVLVGSGKKYFNETEEYYQRPICPPYSSTDYEAYRINYGSLNGDLDFSLELNSSPKSGYAFHVDVSTIDREYEISSTMIGITPSPEINDQNFLPEISINGVTYYKARKMIGLIKNTLIRDTTSYILYNVDGGILKIVTQTESFIKIKQ